MTNQNRTSQPQRGQSNDEQFRPQRDPQQDRHSQHMGSPDRDGRAGATRANDDDVSERKPEERSRSTKENENQGSGPQHVGDQSRTR